MGKSWILLWFKTCLIACKTAFTLTSSKNCLLTLADRPSQLLQLEISPLLLKSTLTILSKIYLLGSSAWAIIVVWRTMKRMRKKRKTMRRMTMSSKMKRRTTRTRLIQTSTTTMIIKDTLETKTTRVHATQGITTTKMPIM